MSESKYERYVYVLGLFVLGVGVLGHGVAATVFVESVTPATVALPLVGSAVAYRSFVGLLPAESSLTADGFLVLLATLTAGFVNLVGPAVYRSATVSPGALTPPGYWNALVVGVAGFTALGVYELLAGRVGGRYALVKLLGASVVAIGVGLVLLVAPTRPVAVVTPIDVMAGLAGAILAAVLFDYTAVRKPGTASK
jgi:hypothetical protein